MPIKGLTDRGLRFPVIGKIRKGTKVKGTKNGKEYERPVDLDYFRVEFDEQEQEAADAFRAAYGDKPTDINIILPFNEIEKVWDAYYEAYQTGRMIARSDGEYLLYQVDARTGEVLAVDGKYKDGTPAPHPADLIVGTDYQNRPIKLAPIGRMSVVVPELKRAAYLDVVTGSYNDIRNISDQLRALAQINGGQIAGVPMVLRRRPRKISAPVDGKKEYVTKWLLSVEADPKWVAAKLAEMNRLALPSGEPEEILELPAGLEDDEEGHYIMAETFESQQGRPPEPGKDFDPDGHFSEEDYAYLSGQNTEHITVQIVPDAGDGTPEAQPPDATEVVTGELVNTTNVETPMDYANAIEVMDSKGRRYGDLPDSTLEFMSKAINNKLMALRNKKSMTQEELADFEHYSYKMDAIKTIFIVRAQTQKALEAQE